MYISKIFTSMVLLVMSVSVQATESEQCSFDDEERLGIIALLEAGNLEEAFQVLKVESGCQVVIADSMDIESRVRKYQEKARREVTGVDSQAYRKLLTDIQADRNKSAAFFLNLLGNIEFSRMNYAAAEQFYSDASSRDPSNLEYAENLSQLRKE